MHYSGSFFYRERNAFFFLARLPPHLSCSLFQNLQDLRVTDGKLINEYGFTVIFWVHTIYILSNDKLMHIPQR